MLSKKYCEENRSNLQEANLWRADLQGANLWRADLQGANLGDANLWRADLQRANLWKANLWEANLWDADLRDAKLRGADLRGAKGVRYIHTYWIVTISSKYMQIGCEYHSHTEWQEFKDSRIRLMDKKALSYWNTNKAWLLELCKVVAQEETFL